MEMKKKGLMDIVVVIAFVFTIAIAALIVTTVFTEMDTLIQDTPLAQSPTANETWQESLAVAQNFDVIVLAAFIALIIIALVLAMVIPAHPVFIPVYIILAIFLILIAVPLSNAYQDIAATDNLVANATAFYPMANFIMGNLPLLVAVLIGIMMIVTYSKGGLGYER